MDQESHFQRGFRSASTPPLLVTMDSDDEDNNVDRRNSASPADVVKAATACLDRRKRGLALVLVALVAIYSFARYSGIFLVGSGAFSPSSLPSTSSSSKSTISHYAVVVDAGSSGSRAYLYGWPEHTGDPRDLLEISPLMGADGNPLVKKVTPGLSSLQDDPDSALSYISPLLDFAAQHIPQSRLGETPLYILATAGMRLLEKSRREAVVSHLRQGIRARYPFLFPDGNLEVISGKQEGIYQWLSINYVLGKFSHDHESDRLVSLGAKERDEDGDKLVLRPRTVGALDMGGASMQVALEVTSDLQMEGMSERERSDTVEINLGCRQHDTEHTYRVFVTTFLGFGANEALARHRRELILEQIPDPDPGRKQVPRGLSQSDPAEDPCLPSGMRENASVTFAAGQLARAGAAGEVAAAGDAARVFLLGTGDWDACYRSVARFTEERERFSGCEDDQGAAAATGCPDAGMKVPPLQIEDLELYGFSEFWYSMEDVLKMGGPYNYEQYKKTASDFCRRPWSDTWRRFSSGEFPSADRERVETQCFKSAWVSAALHQGLDLPASFSGLSSAPNAVQGKVVHWTLGALLYRTRYLPLRSIESGSNVHRGIYHSAFDSGYLYSQYIVLACLFLVCLAIALYLHRLKRYVKPSTLRKVPSLAFFTSSPTPTPSSNDRDFLMGVTSSYDDAKRGGRAMFYA